MDSLLDLIRSSADTVRTILAVLLPIGIGILLRGLRVFDERDGEVLRRFVVRFTVPLFIFFAIYEAQRDSIAAIAPMTTALILFTVALFAIGWGVSMLFPPGPQRTAVHACLTFCNYGWMGFGICGALLGEEGVQRVVYFLILWWPVFYGFGLLIGLVHAREQKGGLPIRRTLSMALPPVGAMLIGLGLNLGSVRLPGLVDSALRPFGHMTVPLILLSVGLMLDFSRLRGALKPAVLITAVTLLVGPLIGWGLAAGLAPDAVGFKALILEAAMPVATVTPILEENYAMDTELVGTAIVLSTVASLVTLPLIALIVV